MYLYICGICHLTESFDALFLFTVQHLLTAIVLRTKQVWLKIVNPREELIGLNIQGIPSVWSRIAKPAEKVEKHSA
jgi:hypothetical protein